jgi:hypothetical protein
MVSDKKIFMWISHSLHRVLGEIKFGCGSHLVWRSEMPDTILEGDHPRIISAKFGWDWLSSFRGEDFFLISSPFFLFLAWRPSWLEVRITGHNFGRRPSKDHSTKVWLQLAQWFLRRRFLCEFPIGFYVKLSSVVGAILVDWAEQPDTFLEDNHPMTISSTFSSYWANGFRQEDFYGNFP